MSLVDSEHVRTCLLFILHLEPSSAQRLLSTCVWSTKPPSLPAPPTWPSVPLFCRPLADERGGEGRSADVDRWLLLPLCVAVRVGHRRHWPRWQEQGAQRQDLLLPDRRAGPGGGQVSFRVSDSSSSPISFVADNCTFFSCGLLFFIGKNN